MDHILEIDILKVGTLYVGLIIIRVSLVGPFMSYYRLQIESLLAIVIILARVVANL